uniref:Uncharacterized protein n=1 Tax=Manihot esculenta TaxID=3983 RepID=A0A2C9UQW3_MANES
MLEEVLTPANPPKRIFRAVIAREVQFGVFGHKGAIASSHRTGGSNCSLVTPWSSLAFCFGRSGTSLFN